MPLWAREQIADVSRRMARLEGDFLDVVRKWGESIESGKRADLVVVNGDPYEFEKLPDRIEAVYKDGVRLVG